MRPRGRRPRDLRPRARPLLLVGLLLAAASASGVAAARPTHPATGGPATECPFTVGLAAAPSSGLIPLLVRLNASVSSGTPELYRWSFGDGSFWNASGAGANDPVHEYEAQGLYNASVLVVEAGCSAGAQAAIAASVGPISVRCSASPTSGVVPLSVTFNCTAQGGSGTYVSTIWTFGDGGQGSGFTVRYTYERAGAFDAALNVTDSLGHWSLGSVRIDARSPATTAPPSLDGIPWVGVGAAVGGFLVAAAAIAWSLRPGRTRPPAATVPPPPGASPGGAAGPGPGPTSADAASAGTVVPVAPPSPAPGPARRLPDREALRLTQRVVLHLGGQARLGPNDVATAGRTQAGMAEALQVGQNSLTNVLRRLEATGAVAHELRHVEGRPRRLRAYWLTPRGESLWHELRRRSPPSPAAGGADAPPSEAPAVAAR